MKKQFIADVNMHEVRVALLEDDDLAEIFIEPHGQERLVGNIYKGKVENVLPGMQAAFIDVGLNKNAFLYVGDIVSQNTRDDFLFDDTEEKIECEDPRISDLLKKDQEIMVQVIKQQGGTKGVRVTTNITLPGRNIVFMPTVEHIGVSRKIVCEEERERLRNAVIPFVPKGAGVIVRTAAAKANIEELAAEIKLLEAKWFRIKENERTLNAPRLIHSEENLLFRTVRDQFDEETDRFLINDFGFYQKVLNAVNIIQPELADRVCYFDKPDPIFDYFNIESKIEKALQRKIWLKSGAYLIIDETEALTAVDVNTGKFIGDRNLQETILKTNLEAAREIARQLRLRDIGGIIIIDFIDMADDENKKLVVKELTEALKKDRTKTNVIGMTELGLVEMTRKKMRRKISAFLDRTCPCCGGKGRVYSLSNMAMKLRREIIRLVNNSDTPAFLVETGTELVEYILEKNTNNEAILPHFEGRHFYITENKLSHPHDIKVEQLIDTRSLIKLGKDAQNFF